MILGDPIIFGSRGGALSASDAILVVTVPTGSTVTATKGGVTITPTIWVTAADPTLDCAIFAISASLFDAVTPWTVTATLGTESASDTVIIDSNKQYDLELSYALYLVKNGALISGVTISRVTSEYIGSTITINDTENPVNVAITRGHGFYFSAVDVSDYSTLVFDASWLGTGVSWFIFGLTQNDFAWHNGSENNLDAYKEVLATFERQEQTLDITALSGTYYFKVYLYGDSTTSIYNLAFRK